MLNELVNTTVKDDVRRQICHQHVFLALRAGELDRVWPRSAKRALEFNETNG